MTLSVVIITHNEEANLARTLESVMPLVSDGNGEIIVVDSGSTDGTVEIAKSFGAKVFAEGWKGYAAQKNSAIDKATNNWVLSLDADEELSPKLAEDIAALLKTPSRPSGFFIPRKNMFLGRWIRHGGFWPDPKLRLFDRTGGRFENRAVHEGVALRAMAGEIVSPILHHSYPTLSDYIEHMNRYSSLGAEMVVAKSNGKVSFRVAISFYVLWQHSSTTTSSVSAFSTAAKVCCCISTTQFTFRGSTPRRGNSRANNRDVAGDVANNISQTFCLNQQQTDQSFQMHSPALLPGAPLPYHHKESTGVHMRKEAVEAAGRRKSRRRRF